MRRSSFHPFASTPVSTGQTDLTRARSEVKTYYSQWATLTLHDGLLYRQWRTPYGKATLLQLLVPHFLQCQVLRIVHGSVGTGSKDPAEIEKPVLLGGMPARCRALCSLLWCMHSQEGTYSVTPCPTATVPGWGSHGINILGPFPVSEAGNWYILIAMDYFTKWPEHLKCVLTLCILCQSNKKCVNCIAYTDGHCANCVKSLGKVWKVLKKLS